MPLDQSQLPIILLLQGGSFFLGPLPLPFIFGSGAGIVRPEVFDSSRQSRSTYTPTFGGGFVDSFGIAPGTITLSGTTGWNNPEGFAGVPALLALKSLFYEYHARRERTAKEGGDPNSVKLYYIDTLNMEACTVLQEEFTFRKSRQRPLLWDYRIRFRIIEDHVYSLVFQHQLPNLPLLRDLGQLASGLSSVISQFGGSLLGLL